LLTTVLDIFEQVSAALFQNRREDRRRAKDPGCFGQASYVVDQQSSIDVLPRRIEGVDDR